MKNTLKIIFAFVVLGLIMCFGSCSSGFLESTGDGFDSGFGRGSFMNGATSDDRGEMDVGSSDGMPEMPDSDAPGEEAPGDEGEDLKPEQIVLPAGMITAGAWNDNEYYQAWLDLFMQSEDANGKFYNYTNPTYSWGFNSLSRVAVKVTDRDVAVAGASIALSDSNGEILFKAITDAEGNAFLFTDEENGKITVTSGIESVSAEFTKEERNLTVNLSSNTEKLNVIEIMLVVDVTGSMGDEIDFLKAELRDVVNRIAANDKNTAIRLALLFYRDTDDAVPFHYYDFIDVTTAKGLADQQEALDEQRASGGGDYPEAVDSALDLAVNKQWSTSATTKIIFHLLDAPAHSGDKYANKLVNATKTAAEKGIRICPIICSGAASVTEYTMREVAIYTGGTFIFVTDDSGIGNSHHDPDLPNVTVELLNSLMVRLVKGYHTGDFEDPIYWKQDPNIGSIN